MLLRDDMQQRGLHRMHSILLMECSNPTIGERLIGVMVRKESCEGTAGLHAPST